MVTYSEAKVVVIGSIGVCTSKNMVTYSYLSTLPQSEYRCMHIKKYGDIQRWIAENRFLHRCMCIENIGNIQRGKYENSMCMRTENIGNIQRTVIS